MIEHIKTKVCIVGSGIAGCLCAKYLASSTNDILIVERGGEMTHEMRLKMHRHELAMPTAAHHHAVRGPFSEKKIQYVYALGGTTNHWIGQTPRFLPSDFRMKSLYGVMDDWPITYEELEPFYCLAEEEMSIAGSSDNPRIPRSKPYPLPAHVLSPADLLFRECFPSGAVVSLPQARPTAPVENRPACCGTATCGLCPVDAKYTALNTHIPKLRPSSSVRFLTETVVLALSCDSHGRIRRAIAINNANKEISIEAEIFVLAANALENAALILRSSEIKHHPVAGHYLYDHPNFGVSFLISKDGHPNYGQSLFTAHCYQFYDGDFRRRRAAALGEIFNPGMPITDFLKEAVSRGLTGSLLREEVSAQYRKQITINFLLEDKPERQNFIRIGKNRGPLRIPQTEIFYKKYSPYVHRARSNILEELPVYLKPLGIRRIFGRQIQDNTGHLLGTCRMGDYQNGAVDSSLRYHHADNLYILGGSAFPTYSPANPTLTIAALAVRLGHHLRDCV